MNYNPYDLVPLVINGKATHGRPYEFDSDVVDQKNMKNSFGNYVKPSKVVTTCPDCSQAVHIDVKLGSPPFAAVEYSCSVCKPPPPVLLNPFVNPVKTGRVQAQDLDPLVKGMPAADSVPVLPIAPVPPTKRQPKQRVKLSAPVGVQQSTSLPHDGSFLLTPTKASLVNSQKAEGISEEVDFDDADMVEE